MEASDGRTKELGITVGRRRARWEKPMVGGSLTRHPCNCAWGLAAREDTRVGARLPEFLPLVDRSGQGDSNGGVVGQKQ